MNEEIKNLYEDDAVAPDDVLKAMNEAATYSGSEMTKESMRKRKNKNAQKKGKPTKPNKDREERKSKAQELQNKLNEGANFMANLNVGRKQTNNVVGEAVNIPGFDVNAVLGDRESFIKQRINLECTKEIGIDDAQMKLIEGEYEILKANVRAFDLDTIPTLEQFKKYFNTYGAVATQRMVNSSWWVYYVDGEETKKYTFKDVKEHFIQPWLFAHAVNQFGRYTNNDLGITVDPVWSDFRGIGLLSPDEVATVAQRVAKLYELSGIKILRGIMAEPASNPEMMTSHEESVTMDGITTMQYRQYFRHVNIAEFIYCSRVARKAIKLKVTEKVTEDQEEANTKAVADRFNAAYICSYDLTWFMNINREIILSAMKDI